MADRYRVAVSAGSLRTGEGVVVAHEWTDEGISVECAFTGGNVLHLAVASNVLNDVYREAGRMGYAVGGVRVSAEGGFDEEWHSTGIHYDVALDSRLTPHQIERLLSTVEEVAEIPRALRAPTEVRRVGDV